MIQLHYRDGGPIYTQIQESIRMQIAAGVLQPEDKLPSVRELAAQLSINPNTIQRAYRELEIQGLVKTVPGKGCFVCGLPAGKTPAWEGLDREVNALLNRGVTQEQIIAHIKGGGSYA